MSKSAVPDVYARIIKDVCEASRVDFEEGGVDLGALELLRQGWQTRLSSTKTNTFPWDPKPEPAAKTEATPVLGSSKPAPATLPSNGATKTPSSSNTTPGPQIKQEAQQYGNPQSIQANYSSQQYPQGQPVSAQERAAALLQQQYGSRASAQITRLQNQPPRAPSNENGAPQQAEQYVKQQQEAYAKQQQQQQQPYIKQEDVNQDYRQTYNASVPIKQSQVDGSADAQEEYEAEIAHRRALVAKNRDASDKYIRDRVLASQRDMEGGGLMMPLSTTTSTKARARTQASSGEASSLSRAQGDAPADDEDDEDAINSDLDDSDELDEAEHDEDNVQNIMLCTYDKVQRVKNKWKCTLKDGVLKVEDTDFVFHKGQGEFEW